MVAPRGGCGFTSEVTPDPPPGAGMMLHLLGGVRPPPTPPGPRMLLHVSIN